MLSNRLKQRGDTLVEVLLAMAVIGMVLAASYAIANQSLATGRDAQERIEALKIAESQIERLRLVNGLFQEDDTNPDPKQTNDYCLNDSNTIVLDSASSFCRGANRSNSLYDMKISYNAAAPVYYRITVSWDSLTSRSAGNVELLYRP